MKTYTTHSKARLLIVIGIVLAAVLAPLGMQDYWVHALTEGAIVTLFALSFNLLFGYMGQLSFGQAAYFGAGAYTTVLLISRLGVPFSLSVLAAPLVAAFWAFVGGFFCVRLSGIYFSIMTVVIAQITFVVVYKWTPVTGGPDGFQGGAPPNILRNGLAFYYFTLCVVVPAIVAFWYIVRSPFGHTLRCIRDNSDRTLFLGISIRKHMHAAFVIAGFYAGLSGSLYGVFNRGTSPYYCDFAKSGDPIFMTVIGGVGSVGGPILGAFVWSVLDAFISDITEYWPLLTGLVVLLMILFARKGLLESLEQGLQGVQQIVRRRISQRKGGSI